jgi:hypothetical protein
MTQRRLREGIEFFHFLRDRRRVAHRSISPSPGGWPGERIF